jgi:hypothetical protein
VHHPPASDLLPHDSMPRTPVPTPFLYPHLKLSNHRNSGTASRPEVRGKVLADRRATANGRPGRLGRRWLPRWLSETKKPSSDVAAELAGTLADLPSEPPAMDAILTAV